MLRHFKPKSWPKGSATYGTPATLGTPSNFEWHAEAPSLHISYVMVHTEDILTLTCLKKRMLLTH